MLFVLVLVWVFFLGGGFSQSHKHGKLNSSCLLMSSSSSVCTVTGTLNRTVSWSILPSLLSFRIWQNKAASGGDDTLLASQLIKKKGGLKSQPCLVDHIKLTTAAFFFPLLQPHWRFKKPLIAHRFRLPWLSHLLSSFYISFLFRILPKVLRSSVKK